jgi:hypothetical protein
MLLYDQLPDNHSTGAQDYVHCITTLMRAIT